MNTFTVKMHRSGGDLLLAAADKDLLGRKLREGPLRLEVLPSFYQGEDADEELLLNRLSMCTVANLVGEKVIAAAIHGGYIDSGCVLVIEGVPHAQLAKI
jgi:hypothetical protein